MSDEGLTAWQLLYKLWGGGLPDQETLRLRMMPHEEYEERVLRRAHTVLKNGRYYGTGYPPGADEREDIPTSYWGRLEIHPPSNMAAGGGFEFYDLRFFEATPAAPALKADADTLYLERCKAILKDTGKPPRRTDDEGWASKKLGSRERGRELRRKHETRFMKPDS